MRDFLITYFVDKEMKVSGLRERMTIKYNNPNPLFKKWLQEWLKHSEENNLGNRSALSKALESLEKYPLPIQSARECIILEGFGPTICEMLEKKLIKHRNDQEGTNQHLTAAGSAVEAEKPQKFKRNPSHKSPKKKRTRKEPCPAVIPDAKKKETEEPLVAIMSANMFQIILLVDTQETKGKTKKTVDATLKELDSFRETYEVRHLSVGDFAWIARDASGSELVLPYIVERKRVDDLGSSIRDARFHEQKFRLMQSGIPNVIYMVEMYESRHLGLPFKTIMQAAMNTNVHNGFTVKITDNHHGSMLYLSVLTKMLRRVFAEKILVECPKANLKEFNLSDEFVSLMNFAEFNTLSSKTRDMKVRDFFALQLIQLSGLSVDKALAIVRIYGTPKLLLNAYRDCRNQDAAKNLLANIKYGKANRQIGQKLSENIYEFYHNIRPS
ncbi:crossover junction endonuclease MUS81 isoform X1 [Lutzomyia longipalpis]|uniref:crossover junction endonuclease MUS81 isoform X1 n=2 Tax=Lutzomyia longipalpis TaxID=7200 RepID=UPI002483C973|nr:crossover junction endonuclease MUS81 isoform X1 [Lutzomyia longipalpis]